MSLVLNLTPDSVLIFRTPAGEEILVALAHRQSGRGARVAINAPQSVQVRRERWTSIKGAESPVPTSDRGREGTNVSYIGTSRPPAPSPSAPPASGTMTKGA